MSENQNQQTSIIKLDGGSEGWELFAYPIRLDAIKDSKDFSAKPYPSRVNAALNLLEHSNIPAESKVGDEDPPGFSVDENTKMIKIWIVGENKTDCLHKRGVTIDNTHIEYACPWFPLSMFKRVKEEDIIPELHVFGWFFRSKIISAAANDSDPTLSNRIRCNYDIILRNIKVYQKGYHFADYGNFEDVVKDLIEIDRNKGI